MKPMSPQTLLDLGVESSLLPNTDISRVEGLAAGARISVDESIFFFTRSGHFLSFDYSENCSELLTNIPEGTSLMTDFAWFLPRDAH